MNNVFENFVRHLDKNNIRFEILKNDDNLILIRERLDKNSSVLMNILIRFDDDTSAQIAFWGLGKTENITYDLLKKINELNTNFRWFKIYINDEGNFIMSYDLLLCENSNDQLMELILRGLNIADECYPRLMKCVWA